MLARIILTYKQHRFETIAVLVVCLGLAALAVYEAWRLFSLHTPTACLNGYGISIGPDGMQLGSDPCQIPSQQRQAVLNSIDMTLVRTLLIFVPFVSGVALGVPLVARELEDGTAPLSWALAGSRWRWLLAKLAAVTLLLVPSLIALALATDFLQSALRPTIDPHASFDAFMMRGAPIVFWGVAALLGSVALGTMLGRTLPAIFIALVVCGFVRVAWEPLMNREVLNPSCQVLVDPLKMSDPMYNAWDSIQDDLIFSWRSYLDGKPITDADAQAWWNTHMVTQTGPDGSVYQTMPVNGGGPVSVPWGIPGSQYWPVVLFESGVLLAGALFCGGVALVWVERRRPY
jgi:hypothetical protein